MTQVIHVVGARPNFMKVGPVLRAFEAARIAQKLVHTGQHFDPNMSDVFFDELGLPRPDVNLEVGADTPVRQIAQIMVRLEEVVAAEPPDWIFVYGDINSVLAAGIVAARRGVRLAHVEAGLRSFDRSMPEELNRLVTDQLADLLFTPSEDGDANLIREGIDPRRIVRVGNVMIDTLVSLLPRAQTVWRERWLPEWDGRRFGLVTLHRPSNVDEPVRLAAVVDTLQHIGRDLPLLFPVHPRTRQRLRDMGETLSGVHVLDPLGYIDFLALQQHAAVVITDSGGIQEETTYLGVPCLTVRENTERPITVTLGTNVLVGHDDELLKREVARVLAGSEKKGSPVPLWDGRAGERIAEAFIKIASHIPAQSGAALA